MERRHSQTFLIGTVIAWLVPVILYWIASPTGFGQTTIGNVFTWAWLVAIVVLPAMGLWISFDSRENTGDASTASTFVRIGNGGFLLLALIVILLGLFGSV
jgi:predicted ABC-type exoprotein transport system permease subunit